MIFFKKNNDDDDDEDEEDIEYVLFQGATNGQEANLDENRKLAAAGLAPAKELVSEALAERAESLRLEPKGPGSVASFFVDGMRRPGPRFPQPRANAITQVLKLLAGLDVSIRDKPQRGGIKAEYRDLPFELTVKSQPIQGGGEALTVMFRNLKTKRVVPEDIGMPENIKLKVRQTAADGKGIVIVASPPETGLTTTALCTLRCVDSYMYQCYVLGDLGTREVINVPVFKEEEGHTLDHTIERIKRNEGALTYFTEFTDKERVQAALMSADSIAVMAEMNARDAADGLAKLVALVGDATLVAENLSCVISHKLIRKLCPKCKEAFRPNPKLLAQAGLNEDTKTLYRKARPPEPDPKTGEEPEPCRACGGLGFRARVAIFEMIEGTDGIKEVLMSGGDAVAIRAKAREEKQFTFQKDALRLVEDGTTGLEELQRVFAPPGGPKKKGLKKRPMKKRPPQ
jgi:type II secretory ATPase GspE/PulE/Tfp pilus assembly ATPase PilB-like protein